MEKVSISVIHSMCEALTLISFRTNPLFDEVGVVVTCKLLSVLKQSHETLQLVIQACKNEGTEEAVLSHAVQATLRLRFTRFSKLASMGRAKELF